MKHTILFAAMLCVAMTATANNAKISGRINETHYTFRGDALCSNDRNGEQCQNIRSYQGR